MTIRPVNQRDADAWAALRSRLWPRADAAALAGETQAFFAGASDSILAAAFVAEGDDHVPIAFIELALRAFSDGCDSMPVPHVEGWYVEPFARGRGVGPALMEAAETWARSHGFTEIASDSEIDNRASLLAHEAAGFEEVERLVKFRKRLD